jgi:hypothetical protein
MGHGEHDMDMQDPALIFVDYNEGEESELRQ